MGHNHQMQRFTSNPWSIELAAGWDATESLEFVTVECSDTVGTLRLTPVSSDSIDAASWVETVAKIAYARGRMSAEITCGDFDGNLTEFEAGDEWLRGWSLRAGDFHLDATYRCPLSEAGRDYAIIDEMLRSLRHEAI